METKNALLAIVLSMVILLGYQYFFVTPYQPQQPQPGEVVQQGDQQTFPPEPPQAPQGTIEQPVIPAATITAPDHQAMVEPARPAKDISIETSLYRAVITEAGGGIKSFTLKEYREALGEDSNLLELVKTSESRELPLFFSWGVEPAVAGLDVFEADSYTIDTTSSGSGELVMTAKGAGGTRISRAMKFHDQDYTLELTVQVTNTSNAPLQGAPYLSLTHEPFTSGNNNRFTFTGPALMLDGSLEEVKVDDLKKGEKTMKGDVTWAAYEDSYFADIVVPVMSNGAASVRMKVSGDDKVNTLISADAEIIEPQASREYKYLIYFGPKKVANLKKVGHDLSHIVNFGWFDFMGKPALYLLNFFNKFFHNYGIAIILVTILAKLVLWPLSHKGMKSMKTMQKIQPKMQKLKEKYKDDKERMNQEMMRLYQTYKVNPLGGCLPMFLQIPVFFALYRVLMQAIELRHAPFMLWINDLSAPDRLYIGFDIPYLGGLPVLTLLMGASMFLQQKMTPSTGDPTQAKIMMFMPVIFTFMFLNFASGLVLYWFINNLLSMVQQYVINKQAAAES